MRSHYLLHSFAAAISDTIPTTIATATASNFIVNRNLPARYLDPILSLVRALELCVCRGILGCRRIPLLTKNLAPMILIRSMGAPEECLRLIRVALFLVLASHFSHQRSFCPPSFTHGPCNYCSFEFRPRGTTLKSFFAGCFRSLFTNPFPAFQASRWLRDFLPLDSTVAHPL